MSNFEPVVSVCRHCQNYSLEGRRGGHCTQLDGLVQGGWKACSLAIPPFAPSWESRVGIKGELEQLIKKQWQKIDAVEPQLVNRYTSIESLEACINTSDSREILLTIEESPSVTLKGKSSR